MEEKDIKRTMLKCILVSLEARAKATNGYSMNIDMQIETQVLWKQIDAIKTEIERC